MSLHVITHDDGIKRVHGHTGVHIATIDKLGRIRRAQYRNNPNYGPYYTLDEIKEELGMKQPTPVRIPAPPTSGSDFAPWVVGISFILALVAIAALG